MAYYYSASERAFFSSELMSTDAMPSDKVAVADQAYKQLMADQVAGKLIRTGSGNAPKSVDQGLTAATRFGDVSFGKVTGTNLDINGNGDVSGTFVVGGAATIKGSLNAQGGLNVTSITATGTSTLAAVNATNISASGTLKVNGASTLQAVSAKKVTATELDLNGNGDVSGNLVVHGKTTLEALQANGDATIGGLLKVTGQAAHGNRITFNTNQWLFGSRSDVSVSDTERDSSKNIIVYRIADRDGAALISEEAYFNQDGSRDLRFNGRNRANTSWRLFLTIKEYANEEVRIIAADSPSASVNDHTLITAKWANNAFVHLTGDEEINGWKKFYRPINVYASTGLEVVRPDQDFTKVPETTTQTWFARYRDKNGKGGLLLKHFQYASGETTVVLSDINFYNADNEDGDWSSLEIGHRADGTRYVRANHSPAETSNGYEVVTTRWLRSYIWNAEQSQLVHTVNAEKINGAKTFTSSLLSASSTFIKSVPWEGVSIADTSRAKTANRTICEVIDKDGLRFMGLESTANTEGSRTFQVTARRRDNSGWINFLQIAEDNAGNAYFKVSQSPVTSSDDNSIATTAWVRALFKAGLGSAIPSGVAFPYAGKTVPSGFMACNGGTISRTTYAKLFAAIGTAWGAGDGSTTFKLPDWRNRTVMGANAASEVGTYLKSGAPNITGTHGGHAFKYGDRYNTEGAYYGMDTQNGGAGDGGNTNVYQMGFDASLCNPIYGSSDIIQPPAGKALWIIKV
jgi:hypothetical protein